MSYCTNCGQQVTDGAKFCTNCGTPVLKNAANNERKTVFDGEIHKCPNCGEIIKSFEINCTRCGFELRNVKASNAVREFVLKLETIDLENEKSKKTLDAISKYTEISEKAEKKINLIRNFNIPNSKEDMLEFAILASANIKTSVYDIFNSDSNSKDEKEINEAWISKIQQVYDKATVSYFNDETFTRIERIYNESNKKIFEAKKKSIFQWVLLVGWIPIAYGLILLFG